MPGTTLHSAILLLVAGNALAVVSDVFVKVIGDEAPVFQFIFARSLITLVLLLPFLRQLDHRRLFEGFNVHLVRAHMHLLGVFCMVVALTSLPLATANAVFYVAPIIVLLLSVLFFGEKLSIPGTLAVFSGFAGIVVILRPSEFDLVAFSALGAAAALAVGAVLVRLLPPRQSTVHKLFLNYLLLCGGSPPRRIRQS